MIAKNVAIELRAMRHVHGKTLKDVSRVSGLSISYLSDLEHGRAMPTLETLEKIAAVYKTRLELYFVYG